MLHLLDSLEAAAHAAAQALLNGLWQGVLLTLVVALVLHCLRGTTAATRHAAWFATLLVVVALPLAAASLASRGAPAMPGPPLEERAASAEGDALGPIGGVLLSEGAGTMSRAPADASAARFTSPVWRLAVPPGAWLLLLLGSGLLVGLARMGRLIHGLRALRRLKSASRALPLTRQAELEPLCAAHARRRVGLRLSDRIATPITVGFRHPAVLIPAALLEELSREELAQIVLHELAHIRRGDDWTNLAQRLAEAVLFFHPAVWWIGRRLELERELACDDDVVASLAGERAYARCLTRLAERALASRREALAPGAAPRASQLARRVRALLAPDRPRGVRVSPLAASALVALLAARRRCGRARAGCARARAGADRARASGRASPRGFRSGASAGRTGRDGSLWRGRTRR